MRCPNCGTEYAFFEKTCTRCGIALLDENADASGDVSSEGTPDTTVVPVFKTSDPAVLPLATMALESEGIDYQIKHAGKSDSLEWMMSQVPTNRPMVVEIVVGSDVAARARDLLVDLENPTAIAAASAALAQTAAAPEAPAAMLEDAVTGKTLGTITESDLQEITSHLSEEKPREYFVTGATVDMLEGAGADAELVDLLRKAIGANGSGRAIRWVVR